MMKMRWNNLSLLSQPSKNQNQITEKSKHKKEKTTTNQQFFLLLLCLAIKKRKRQKSVLIIFTALDTNLFIYNQQMKKCVIIKAANFAMIDSQYFCMFNKSE